MLLKDKLQILRSLEGNLRGLNRALTKSDVVRLIGEELGESISQAYLSQLESGKRPHMTEKTRDLLSRFFKVHPGFFVNDPEGFGTELTSMEILESRLDEWLMTGCETFVHEDAELAGALRSLAAHKTTRQLLILLAELVRNPESVSQLRRALESTSASSANTLPGRNAQ